MVILKNGEETGGIFQECACFETRHNKSVTPRTKRSLHPNRGYFKKTPAFDQNRRAVPALADGYCGLCVIFFSLSSFQLNQFDFYGLSL